MPTTSETATSGRASRRARAPRADSPQPPSAAPPAAAEPSPGAPRDAEFDAQVEALTLDIGRRIFRLTAEESPGRLHPAAIQDAMMALLMKDEDLRYRMLRFVDVYPALKSGRAIAAHFQEYLTSKALDTGLKQTPLSATARSAAGLGRKFPAVTKWASRFGVAQMAKQFIAGDTPESVAKRIAAMERGGMLFSLDLLGEFVASEKQAQEFADRYLEMIERFETLLGPPPAKLPKAARACAPRVNISIKLSSLTSKFEPADPEGTSEAVRERLRPLFRAAIRRGVFLNIDMEKYEYRDLSLRIIVDLLSEDEFRGFPNIGTVAQAYLKDADVTLVRFLDALAAIGQPITIRLVKGAYWDSEQLWGRQRGWPIPVITVKRDTDAMYERCLRILMERHDSVRTAVGSHNVRSIAHALALKKAFGVEDGRFECQMLFGMAGPIKDALRRMGVPVRIYTPCGDMIPGMAYLVRRILENTSNESFLRQRFSEGADEERLLANPKA